MSEYRIAVVLVNGFNIGDVYCCNGCKRPEMDTFLDDLRDAIPDMTRDHVTSHLVKIGMQLQSAWPLGYLGQLSELLVLRYAKSGELEHAERLESIEIHGFTAKQLY